MTFGESVRTVLREKYATFEGRAARSEYWWYTLFIYILGAIITLLFMLTGGTDFILYGAPPTGGAMFVLLLGAILVLGIIIPSIAVSVRRFHDRNMSGWWYLGFIVLSMLPVVGIIASIAQIVIFCLKGTDGENRFGPDPLGGGIDPEVFA